jgi:hypothetical protein
MLGLVGFAMHLMQEMPFFRVSGVVAITSASTPFLLFDTLKKEGER